MDSGQVEMLLILGGNPVFTVPADFGFTECLPKVPLRVHLSLYQDETARQCHWHLPEAHYLETWSDTRSFEGSVSIVQPLIEPLYAGHSAHELIAALIPLVSSDAGGFSWRQRHRLCPCRLCARTDCAPPVATCPGSTLRGAAGEILTCCHGRLMPTCQGAVVKHPEKETSDA